jgi:hypothetical protein
MFHCLCDGLRDSGLVVPPRPAALFLLFAFLDMCVCVCVCVCALALFVLSRAHWGPTRAVFSPKKRAPTTHNYGPWNRGKQLGPLDLLPSACRDTSAPPPSAKRLTSPHPHRLRLTLRRISRLCTPALSAAVINIPPDGLPIIPLMLPLIKLSRRCM